MIRFFVAGIPKSMKVSGIARFRRGGQTHMVPKRGNDEWVTLVGAIGRQHQPERPFEGPIVFTTTFYLPRPKSAKKARYPLKRPDYDNLTHKLSDQFNGVFWQDDSQVVDAHIHRRFADERPGVEILVEELTEQAVLSV